MLGIHERVVSCPRADPRAEEGHGGALMMILSYVHVTWQSTCNTQVRRLVLSESGTLNGIWGSVRVPSNAFKWWG